MGNYLRLWTSAVALPFVMQVSALAQDEAPVNSWKTFDVAMSYSGDGFSKKRRATIDKGEAIYTTSQTTNGAMLTCLEGKLYATLALKPQDFMAAFHKSTRTHKIRRVDYSLDNSTKKPLGKWIHKPTLDVLASFKRSQAAKIYNSAIRGQKVTLYMEGKKPVILDLPKPNQAFANFGAECGLGINAKKTNR